MPVFRMARCVTKTLISAQLKSCMLASLRSLLPKELDSGKFGGAQILHACELALASLHLVFVSCASRGADR